MEQLKNDALSGNDAKQPQYAGTYDDKLKDVYDKIESRAPFRYDADKDPMYKLAKDRYVRLGKLSMQDSMGKAAALTGGYASSYGQQVGQQAYDKQLQKLDEVVPELYQLAYTAYQNEGKALSDQAASLASRQAEEYGRYRDELSDYREEQALQRSIEQERYERERAAAETAYQRQRDALSTQQTNYSNLLSVIKASGYKPTDAELTAAGMTRAAADALRNEYLRSKNLLPSQQTSSSAKTRSGSSSGSSGSSGSSVRSAIEKILPFATGKLNRGSTGKRKMELN